MDIRRVAIVAGTALFVCFVAPAGAQTAAEWAVAPLPTSLRAGAAIWEFEDGRAVERRAGTNGFICTADEPGNAVFHVECVSPGYADFLLRQRELEATGMSRAEVVRTLTDEIAAGALRIEPGATKTNLQARLGEDGTIPDELRWDFQVYVPGETSDTTGIPSDTLQDLGFTMMAGGTPEAHVHVRRLVDKATLVGTGGR